MKLKLLLFPLCLIVLQAFGFEGTVKQTVKNYNGTGTNITMTWYMGPNNCRIDMTATGKDVKSNTVLIMDPTAKTLKTYEANSQGAQKLYFQINASTISGDLSILNINATQETKQINGYKCEKWIVITSSGTYNVWITKDIVIDWSVYKDFFKTSVDIQAMVQQGVKGFAMLIESATGSNSSSVDAVDAHSLSASIFAVPAEYTLYVPQVSTPKSATPAKRK